MSKQTFDTLYPAQSNRARQRHFIMEIPVISTIHLPPKERESLEARARSGSPEIMAHEITKDYWSVILYIEDCVDDEDAKHIPVFAALVEELAERGFSYARFDPDAGDTFHDLPTFDTEQVSTGESEQVSRP